MSLLKWTFHGTLPTPKCNYFSSSGKKSPQNCKCIKGALGNQFDMLHIASNIVKMKTLFVISAALLIILPAFVIASPDWDDFDDDDWFYRQNYNQGQGWNYNNYGCNRYRY